MRKVFKRGFFALVFVFVMLVLIPLCDTLGFDAGLVDFGIEASAYSESGSCGENVTYTLDRSTGELVISGSGPMADYNGYGDSPFWLEEYYIRKIIIKEGITHIGNWAFYFCDNLISVTMPTSLKSIGKDAFGCCDSLASITIPNGVTKIGTAAFSDCGSLKNITIPASVTNIENEVFSNCISLVSMTIPNGVTGIGAEAFWGCESLKDITIPVSVTKIGGDAFFMTDLTNVYYKGTKEQWKNIKIEYDNYELTDAKIHYHYGNHTYKTVTTKATIGKDGKIETKCTGCGMVSKTVKILQPAKFTLSAKKYTYDGKVKTPSVTVKDSNGNTLKKDTDYTVKHASGRKNTGKYSVTITFKGNYSGTKKLYFNILPKATSKLSLTPAATSIKAKWSKVTGASGYKVVLLSSKDKVLKTVYTTKTEYNLTKLSEKTTYKVKVTAYKTIDSKKVYSSSSKTVSTKTKTFYGVELKNETQTIYVGASKTLSYSVYPKKSTVKWKTSDSSIAKVSSSGKVTALKKGTVTITASVKYKNKTYKSTCKITVKKPSISLNKSEASVYMYNTLTLKATAKPDSVTVKWKTSDKSIAKVSSSGKVTGVKKGTATITAYFTYGGKTYQKSCKVTVKKQNPITITYFDWYINSADGVEPELTIRNNTNKDIKYIDINTTYKNRFGDPAYCELSGKDSRILMVSSGLSAKQTRTFYWDPVIYNGHVSRIDIKSVTVTFVDNTKVTFKSNDYWYDQDYYYQ